MVRVLVVEDEIHYRENLDYCLTDEGYDVATAHNGQSAIEVAARFRPQILIADWMLHNSLTGLDVFRMIRKSLPGLETILITGFPSDGLRADAKESQVFEIFEKPFDLDDLLLAVRFAAKAHEDQPGA